MAQEVQQESMGGYPEMGASKGVGLKTIGLPVILSVMVVVVLAFMGFLPGSAPNYIANTQALNTKIDDNASEIASMRSAVADASANASQASADAASVRKDITAVQGSVSGFASQSNLNALKQELDTLKSSSSSGVTKAQYDTLSAKVDTLSSQLADANTKITALQNGTGTNGNVVGGEVTVSLIEPNYVADIEITNSTQSETYYSETYRLKIDNGQNREIKNLQLHLQVYGEADGSFPDGVLKMSASQGQWYVRSLNGHSWMVTNVSPSSWTGSNLNIPANSTKVIMFNFSYTIPAEQGDDTIQFFPEVAPISDWDYE